jgi:hypothetical protein
MSTLEHLAANLAFNRMGDPFSPLTEDKELLFQQCLEEIKTKRKRNMFDIFVTKKDVEALYNGEEVLILDDVSDPSFMRVDLKLSELVTLKNIGDSFVTTDYFLNALVSIHLVETSERQIGNAVLAVK